MNLSGIVLAGGKALRMGGEKPLKELRGKSLLQHAIDLVAPLCGEVVVSAGDRELHLPSGVISVPDPKAFAGMGPLAGILAALEVSKGDMCLIVPCDLPNLRTQLMAELYEELGDKDAVYCRLDDGPEPLVAAVRRAAATKAVRASMNAGNFKVVPCWDSMGARVKDSAWVATFGPPADLFANINTDAQLKRQQQR